MEESRISKNRIEIINFLKQSFDANSSVIIWQKDLESENRSFLCEVQFNLINEKEGVFSIKMPDENTKKSFNPKLETYFLLKSQNFSFKTKTAISGIFNQLILSFQIPRSIKREELRQHPRIYIKSEEKRFVNTTFYSKNNPKEFIKISCPIYNISNGGICIIVSKETLSIVDLNESISLEGLGFFENLPNSLEAVIRNARIYQKQGLLNDNLYALGLEFLPRLKTQI